MQRTPIPTSTTQPPNTISANQPIFQEPAHTVTVTANTGATTVTSTPQRLDFVPDDQHVNMNRGRGGRGQHHQRGAGQPHPQGAIHRVCQASQVSTGAPAAVHVEPSIPDGATAGGEAARQQQAWLEEAGRRRAQLDAVTLQHQQLEQQSNLRRQELDQRCSKSTMRN